MAAQEWKKFEKFFEYRTVDDHAHILLPRTAPGRRHPSWRAPIRSPHACLVESRSPCPRRDATDVAGLMRAADAAVGAGGASTWERCALGLPTLAVVVAENQRAMISAMAGEGRLLAADIHAPGFEEALRTGFEALQRSEVRARLSKAARALCDGRGASRVAEAVMRRLSGAGTPGS